MESDGSTGGSGVNYTSARPKYVML